MISSEKGPWAAMMWACGIPAAAQDSREDTVGRTLAQTRFMSKPI